MDRCQSAGKERLRGKRDYEEEHKGQSSYFNLLSTLFTPAACYSVKAWKQTDKKGFNENIIGMKLLPGPITQDVCVPLTLRMCVFH